MPPEPASDAAAPAIHERAAGHSAHLPQFNDADGASRWVKTLPVTDIPRTYAAVMDQLSALAALELGPRERARIAEVFRDEVAYLHTELARRYAGRPQPLLPRERDAADQAIALWHALWEQYSACLKPLLDGDSALAPVKSKLLQRGLHVGKELVLVYGLARRVPPPSLWQELHAYYRLAEALNCAGTAVTDPLMPSDAGVSCYSTYSHALLLGLAEPYAMSVKQIQLTDRWLQMWSRKVYPYPQQREVDGPLILVDLGGSTGATLALVVPQRPGEMLRYAYAEKLATSVRGRLKRLQAGANPAELQLGHDCSAAQCTTLLAYLDGRWYQPPRRQLEGVAGSIELCAGGFDAAFFRIGGRTFDRRPEQRAFRAQIRQQLASLDALSDYDRGKDEAERAWAWELWHGTYEWNEALLVREGEQRYRWQLDQLVAVHEPEGPERVGYVTRVSVDDEGKVGIALRVWSGTPKSITLRPVLTALSEEHPPMPALLLSETPDDPSCLVLPSRSFNPSRVLRTVDGGRERRFRLTGLLQRGADFERAAFENEA